jgi:hypothetical protein
VANTTRCATCEDCYFRKVNVCALKLPEPCPTFRPVLKGRMVPPKQPRLVPRQPVAVA